MERLRDTHFELGSLEAEARELLAGAEPYSVPAALKRNVRVRLVEAAPRRGAPLWFRVAIVAAALGVVGAAAAVGKLLQAPKQAKVVLALTSRVPPPGAPLAGVSAPLAVPAQAKAALEGRPVGVAPAANTDAAKHADTHPNSAQNPAVASEASLVYETARALRNEGDPARAAHVLDDYFKRYPHGALAEEALALAIDVAVARGDARAKTLASRYLSQYPNGHFRAKAQRVLAAE